MLSLARVVTATDPLAGRVNWAVSWACWPVTGQSCVGQKGSYRQLITTATTTTTTTGSAGLHITENVCHKSPGHGV